MVILTLGAGFNMGLSLSPCPILTLGSTVLPGEISSHYSVCKWLVAQLESSINCVSGSDFVIRQHSWKMAVSLLQLYPLLSKIV